MINQKVFTGLDYLFYIYKKSKSRIIKCKSVNKFSLGVLHSHEYVRSIIKNFSNLPKNMEVVYENPRNYIPEILVDAYIKGNTNETT